MAQSQLTMKPGLRSPQMEDHMSNSPSKMVFHHVVFPREHFTHYTRNQLSGDVTGRSLLSTLAGQTRLKHTKLQNLCVPLVVKINEK